MARALWWRIIGRVSWDKRKAQKGKLAVTDLIVLVLRHPRHIAHD